MEIDEKLMELYSSTNYEDFILACKLIYKQSSHPGQQRIQLKSLKGKNRINLDSHHLFYTPGNGWSLLIWADSRSSYDYYVPELVNHQKHGGFVNIIV